MHIFVSIYAVKIHSVVFNSLLDFVFCFVLFWFIFGFCLFCFVLYLHVSFSESEYMFLYIKTDKSTILNLEYTLDNRVQYASLAQGSGLWVQKVSTGIQTLTPISYPSHAIFQKHLLFDFVDSSFAYDFFFSGSARGCRNLEALSVCCQRRVRGGEGWWRGEEHVVQSQKKTQQHTKWDGIFF